MVGDQIGKQREISVPGKEHLDAIRDTYSGHACIMGECAADSGVLNDWREDIEKRVGFPEQRIGW